MCGVLSCTDRSVGVTYQQPPGEVWFRGDAMKIEITYTKKKGVQIEFDKTMLRLSKVELASVIEEAIQELQSHQLSLMPNNDHM